MRELVDLVPFVQAPEWGAWEPLALTMILAAGVSAVAAGMAALRRANPALVHVLALTSLCSVTSGLMGVFVPLEQPLRVWEFAVHPSFSSWTAWGAYILPLCFLSLLVLLRQSCTRQGPGKLVGACRRVSGHTGSGLCHRRGAGLRRAGALDGILVATVFAGGGVCRRLWSYPAGCSAPEL